MIKGGPDIALELIATPLNECLSFEVGPLDPRTVRALEERGFDQAPVIDGLGVAIGVLATATARAWLDAGIALVDGQRDITVATLPVNVGLDELLCVLGTAPGVIVQLPSVQGLVTVSDLNRRGLRMVLYELLSEVESLCARLIDSTFGDDSSWINWLNEGAQVRVLSYWEVSRRRDLDIGALAGCTLVELLSVVGSSPDLRSLFGVQSKNQWNKLISKLPDYRNRVMHPVRPMVLGQTEVSDLRSVVATLQRLRAAAAAGLADRGVEPRARWL